MDLSKLPDTQRLNSRTPPWIKARKQVQDKFNISFKWEQDRIAENTDNQKLVTHPTSK